MAEVRYKEVKLVKLYDFVKGTNRINKKVINQNKGKYPVYSGSKINDGLMGYINFYDFDGEFIRIITVGKAGDTTIINGKFSLSQNNGVLVSKNEIETENILNEYLKIILLIRLKNKAKGTDTGNKQQSLTNKQILNTTVNIPINKYGNYDIEKQKEIVKKYEIVEEKKKEIKEKLDYFKEVQVDFSNEISSKVVKIDFEELFDIERGKVISKSYINKNLGEYPVYSTQIDTPFGHINSYMYDGCYLIWNTDGLGGFIRKIEGKFSITNIVGIMKLKDKYKGLVDLEYIKRILEPIFRENVKGREGVGGKNEYTKINSTMIKDLNIKINFPLNEEDKIDIEKQKEIVSKYEAIEEMKSSILEKGFPFTLTNIQFDGETPYIYIYIYKG